MLLLLLELTEITPFWFCELISFIIPNPMVMEVWSRTFRKSLGLREESWRMGLVPLWKNPEGACLPLLLCEHAARRYHLWSSRKALSDTQSSGDWLVCVCVVMQIESRTSCILGKCCTPMNYIHSHFYYKNKIKMFFLSFLSWISTWDPPALTFRIARVIGVYLSTWFNA